MFVLLFYWHTAYTFSLSLVPAFELDRLSAQLDVFSLILERPTSHSQHKQRFAQEPLFLTVIYFSLWSKESDFLNIKLTARNGFPQKCSAKKLTACIINEATVSASPFIENIHVNKAINPGDSIKVNVFKCYSPERESYKNIVALHKFF